MDNSSIFAEVFKDYEEPEKDLVGKLADLWGQYQHWSEGGDDPLTRKGIEAFNKYSGAGPGMLGGPTYVKAAIKSGKIPQTIYNHAEQLLKEIKSGNLKFNDPIYNVPGSLNPYFFKNPVVQAMNARTGVVPMPYTKGKTLITMGEIDSPKLVSNIWEDSAIKDVIKNNGIPLQVIADWNDLAEYYPQIWKNLKVRVGNEPIKGSIASGSYHYNSSTGGGTILLDNPEILDKEHLGAFQRLLNHEGQHAISSYEGLSGGGAPSEFSYIQPQGFEGYSPSAIYRMLLDERLAQVAEHPSTSWNTAERITRKANEYPILHKEELVGPGGAKDWTREGKDYGSDDFHYGKTWKEYHDWLTNQFWK